MNFRQEFVALAKNKDWMAAGFFDRDGNFHKFNTDSKTISSNFEIMTTKYVKMIAAKFGYTVERSVQTRYPDFNLIKPGCPHIAVDIKTTYRRPNTNVISYTLGTYKIYQGSKAHFPLHEYGEHWVVGFLYDRLPDEDEYPYDNVEYFVQEKHKIAGMGKISGNTTNIISFSATDIEEFRAGLGPFTHSYEAFYEYWSTYVPKTKR